MKYKYITISVIIILIGTLTPLQGFPSLGMKQHGIPLDKIAHFLIFFYLGLTISDCFSMKRLIILAVVMSMGLGVLTEVLQEHIPGRGAEFMDGVLDILGVILGSLCYQRLKYLKENLHL